MRKIVILSQWGGKRIEKTKTKQQKKFPPEYKTEFSSMNGNEMEVNLFRKK